MDKLIFLDLLAQEGVPYYQVPEESLRQELKTVREATGRLL